MVVAARLQLVMNKFGPKRFGAVVSDDGGGCEKGRRLTKKAFPHLVIQRYNCSVLHKLTSINLCVELFLSLNQRYRKTFRQIPCCYLCSTYYLELSHRFSIQKFGSTRDHPLIPYSVLYSSCAYLRKDGT